MKCYIKDYPRPQFVRHEWENLNGTWEFRFDDALNGEREKWYKDFRKEREIQVPFTYETKKSGIGEERHHSCVWYGKKIQINAGCLQQKDCVLHFEGSDFLTKVWVNGEYAGSHRGGYARFSFDITCLVREGENELVVKVEDSCDMQQPRGKQRWLGHNFGCWYVQTTGIWKTVWMEYVPKVRLESVKMTPDLEDSTLKLEYELKALPSDLGEGLTIVSSISFHGRLISKNAVMASDLGIAAKQNVFLRDEQGMEWGVRTWSPETPDLYDIEFQIIKDGELIDHVESYFAMREIRIEGANILLNGRPFYQRLILDQGYWEESQLTPPDEEALIADIDKIHAMGYNGLRKHQKTEDERFLYWCDVKGMLVWGEMASAYRYSDYAAAEFTREWMEIVKQNYNHPCIIIWTPFNESWGISQVKTRKPEQNFTEAIYHLTKSLDPYRPVIVNDGWEHTVSDIITLHDYEESGEILFRRYMELKDRILAGEVYHCNYKSAFANGYGYRGQPVIISEFGGIAFNNDDSGWGYGSKVDTKEAFIRRFDEITTAVKKLPYVCGFCYTQATDVQQEINGLMDIDRNPKVDPEIIREINERKIGYWRSFM